MCSVVAIGSIRCLAAWNLLSEKGLGRNSSKPIMMAVAAVSSSSRALMLIIASRLQRLPAAISSASNSRNLLAASKPSITGIWRSISTSDRSTEGSKSRFKAAAPFSAVSILFQGHGDHLEDGHRVVHHQNALALHVLESRGSPRARYASSNRVLWNENFQSIL
mmetsp:Transcript_19147/g.26364  ORF Transcript_19147/g.26364 Transcript_19147/m.26364 type:complete len:164 (+) Transcript_19147:177-668(+)